MRIVKALFAIVFSFMLLFSVTATAEESTQEELLAQYYAALAAQQGQIGTDVVDTSKQIGEINQQIEALRIYISVLANQAVLEVDENVKAQIRQTSAIYGQQIISLDTQLKDLQKKAGKSEIVVNQNTIVFPNVLYFKNLTLVPYGAVYMGNNIYQVQVLQMKEPKNGINTKMQISVLDKNNNLVSQRTVSPIYKEKVFGYAYNVPFTKPGGKVVIAAQ